MGWESWIKQLIIDVDLVDTAEDDESQLFKELEELRNKDDDNNIWSS